MELRIRKKEEKEPEKKQRKQKVKPSENEDVEMEDATVDEPHRPKTVRLPKGGIFPLKLHNQIVGQVFVSGSNEAGQLGSGQGADDRSRPQRINYFNDKSIVAVYAGGMHSIALSLDGKLYSWGCNDDAALGRGGDECLPAPVEGLDNVRVVDVACGDSISLALTEYGDVYSWGTYRNSSGLFGHSSSNDRQIRPTKVKYLGHIVSIACGTNHAVAITYDGKVLTWGVGEQGQLCRKIISRHTVESSLTPRVVNFKPSRGAGAKFSKAFCGSYHTFLLHSTGTVYACGLNNYGQLGIGPDAPEHNFDPYPVSDLKGHVVQMAAGEHHSMALNSEGNLYVFGRNDDGQLGIPIVEVARQEIQDKENQKEPNTYKSPILLQSNEMQNVNSIGCACGGYFSWALTKEEENNLWMWGFGENGQLANNGENSDEPEQIDLKGRNVLCVAGGGQHSVFLLKFRESEEA